MPAEPPSPSMMLFVLMMMMMTTFDSWPAQQLHGQVVYLLMVFHWRVGCASSLPGPSLEA